MLKQQWNVLLASNDAEVVDSLLPVFRTLDLNGIVVNRGGEVLLTLLDVDFQLIVLDTDLDGISGTEVFPIIRRIRPRIPVIITSSNLTLDQGKELAENGVLYRLSKPINLDEAREIVKAFRKKLQFEPVNSPSF